MGEQDAWFELYAVAISSKLPDFPPIFEPEAVPTVFRMFEKMSSEERVLSTDC